MDTEEIVHNPHVMLGAIDEQTNLLHRILEQLERIGPGTADQSRLRFGAAVTAIPATTEPTELLDLNVDRRTGLIVNDGTGILYVKFGEAASLTDWSVALNAGDSIDVFPYCGVVTGVWDGGTGQARVTEVAY